MCLSGGSYLPGVAFKFENGFPIIEDGPDLGDEGGYVPIDGLTEPLDAYADLLGGPTAKRRRLEGGGVA